METYLDHTQSIAYACGTQINTVLSTVANRYLAENPALPFVFRLTSEQAFQRNSDYRYVFDLNRVFPNAENEQCVYAWAKRWSDQDCDEALMAVAYSPMDVYVNETLVYHSNFYEEKTRSEHTVFHVQLKRGWNSFVIRFVKTSLGFGGEFGSSFFKYTGRHYLVPTPEREGQEGFLYTAPMEEMEALPVIGESEEGSPVTWYPRIAWTKEEKQCGQMMRLYGAKKGRFAYGWSKLFLMSGAECQLNVDTKSPLTLYLDGDKVLETDTVGCQNIRFSLHGGFHDLVAESVRGQDDWGFSLFLVQPEQGVRFVSPCDVKGTSDPWIYVGAFEARQNLAKITVLDRVFQTAQGKDYWRVDLPHMAVRPFLETPNFANWNYPVGVTLYGLLKTGEALHRPDLADYVKEHIELCTRFYDYSIWDGKKFGAPGINAQIASVESLDDCGSFASTMLECAKQQEPSGYRKIADSVADYISNRQARLPDGSLYRYISSLPEMKNTVWLDDLYMSVPFLSRYYTLTGDSRYVDDAARQFLLYREKMFLPQLKVLSHVYYTDLKLASGVPWGRGNGWVVFALTELLAVLPQDHPLREELLDFYREICEGYLALQDEHGLWHQVLNDPESYPEASCTSMFICAFARGVRNGWLKDTAMYAEAALRGWDGLVRYMVDRDGNLYGICKGSGHSFSPRYYKYDLNWILNDTHGIGVFLMAGAETQNMLTALTEK